MPKRVTFHVGLPKTGTSTIQSYLRSQDQKLRTLGFLYPGPCEHEVLDAWVRHTLMLNAMVGKVKAPSGGLDAQACRQVVASVFRNFRRSDLGNLLWSCEGISSNARLWDANYLKGILAGVDVRIVCFARYTDDWIESFYKEHIWGLASRPAELLHMKPLPPLAALPDSRGRSGAWRGQSMLGRGANVLENLQIMRKSLPSAEIVVRSFDADREKGTVVSGALAAMGVPVEGAFRHADDEAAVRNPTKSDSSSILLYNLALAQADVDVLRDVAAAARKRDNKGLKFEPLIGRRFRFLPEESMMRARGYYEELRQEYPDLPVQPPYVAGPAERCLPRDEAVALLDWLRPNISDTIFDKACAAYPPT